MVLAPPAPQKPKLNEPEATENPLLDKSFYERLRPPSDLCVLSTAKCIAQVLQQAEGIPAHQGEIERRIRALPLWQQKALCLQNIKARALEIFVQFEKNKS